MKLGLGLSLPGVAAMGGKAADRLLSTSTVLLDGRRGSAVTDFGSAGATATNVGLTHSGVTGSWSSDGNDYAQYTTTTAVQPQMQQGVSGTNQSSILLVYYAVTQTGTKQLAGSRTAATGNGAGWGITLSSALSLAGRLGDGTTSVNRSTTVTGNAWHSVLMTMNQSTGLLTMYSDGVIVSTAVSFAALTNSTTNANNPRVLSDQVAGADNGSAFRIFAMWDTVLTAADALVLHQGLTPA